LYYDDLNSSAFKKNKITGVKTITDARYPDGKNNTLKAEGFIVYSDKISKTTAYNASFRAGYSALKSEIVTNFLNLPYTNVAQDNLTYSGAVGIVNNASKKTKIAFNLASAYRVPNIDDLSKIFESVPGTLIVPNNNLNPERSITADLSITFWNGNRFQFENTFYHTRIFDPIVTDTFTLNGQSTIIYEGQKSTILANQNQGKGEISGVSSTLKTYITKALLFYGTFNYSQGKVKNAKGEFPLDHIAPIYGKTGIKYENKFVTFDLFMLYNGKKNLKDYSPSGEDNLQYAPSTGMPAWKTYNLINSLSIINNLTIFSGIENILDTQYRTFSSGINAGGRNVFLGGKYVF
jgi:hemoglobin/transferrin/lactoferrin receptor protein